MLTAPPGAISLRNTDGSPLEILGYDRFVLTLGNKSLQVEALVLLQLGPDAMLIDNSTMKAFGAKLIWAAERLSSKDSDITIPAIHTKKKIRSKYCSVIIQDTDTDTLVFVSNKYVVSATHEPLIRVFSTGQPQTDTLALVEPKIATTDKPQDDMWRSLIVAKMVTNWCAKTRSALVQVGGSSDRSITSNPKL